jgi:hypothetical protein
VYIIEHAKVFAMAVNYQVDGLRDLAAAKFKQSAKTHWNHDDFAHAIFIVHNSTSEGVPQLRDIVADILHERFEKLKHKAEVETVVCSIPHLAYALLKRAGTIPTCVNGHARNISTMTCSLCTKQYYMCKTCPWQYCPSCGQCL